MKIELGKIIEGESSGAFEVDIDRLIATRLLIQASSGGGKSYAIRKLVEMTNGHVQQIILDLEGEFASLKTDFDFLVAGVDGDIKIDASSAELLARKLLETSASVVIDLYEFHQPDRIRFVKEFMDALLDLPRQLWHHVLLVLDEAHIFAPEKVKSESAMSVVDMQSRGRKRGFCLVVATQRPAKLKKDVAAECQNKLIGLANIEIDRKRGADELGIDDPLRLRDMKAGEFFAVGPAFNPGVSRIRIGKVKTEHGQAIGKQIYRAPSEKAKALLAKLSDIPTRAREEKQTLESMQKQIADLKRELAAKPKPEMPKEKIEQMTKVAVAEALRSQRAAFESHIKQANKTILDAISELSKFPADSALVKQISAPLPNGQTRHSDRGSLSFSSDRKALPPARKAKLVAYDDVRFGRCERKILGFLIARYGDAWFTPVQIGALTGYAGKSGSFNTALSKLSSAGLIDREAGRIRLNDEHFAEAQAIAGDETPHSLKDWIAQLGGCEKKVYEYLIQHPSMKLSKEELGECTGYAGNSGSFNTSLSRLSTLGLIKRYEKGQVGINEEILL